MTTDTTATTNPACVSCRKDTDDGYGRVHRRPLLANDGATRYMCGPCYSAMPIFRLRDYHWLPAHSSNQPPPPPRTARPYGGRRVDVDCGDGCALCGVLVDPEWPPVIFELAGLQVLGRRCAACDGAITAADFDAAAYLVSVHGDDLTELSFYAGVVLWHRREGLRPPPAAPERWAF